MAVHRPAYGFRGFPFVQRVDRQPCLFDNERDADGRQPRRHFHLLQKPLGRKSVIRATNVSLFPRKQFEKERENKWHNKKPRNKKVNALRIRCRNSTRRGRESKARSSRGPSFWRRITRARKSFRARLL